MRKHERSWKIKYIAVFALFLCALMITKVKASAAVSVMTQSRVAPDSVTVNWTRPQGALEVYLGIGESESDAKKAATAHSVVLPPNVVHYAFTGLNPGTKYYVVLRYRFSEQNVMKEEQAGSVAVKTTPSKIEGLTQARWYVNTKTVYVTWKPQTAGTYRYVFMDSNGKKIRSGELLKNEFSARVDNNKCYSIKVKGVTTINGRTYDTGWSDRVYLFAQPMIKSHNYGNDFDLSVKKGKLKLKWERTKYANAGYAVYVSKKRDKGYVKVGTAGKGKNTATVKRFKGSSFKKSGTYYVYVQGLRKYGGRVSTTGIGYVWEYKNGRVRKTYYHGKY